MSIECGANATFDVFENLIARNAKGGAGGGSTSGFTITSTASGFGRVHLIDNDFQDNLSGDFSALAGSVTSTLCLKIRGNRADIGYAFDNMSGGGTILLEPMIDNTGGLFVRDAVIYVPAGTCD
jgi:hypothetical protein